MTFVRRIVNSINYRVLAPLTNRDARNWASKTDFRKAHRRLLRQLRSTYTNDEAVQRAVGGEFNAYGQLLRDTLVFHGLKKTDYLIDVGCGSGRLAKPLSEYLTGKYLGIDVVPGLVAYARKLVPRPDWRFEVAEGLKIPEADGQADMVCFFSVLTHLLHEESFVYLREARRVLKPGGLYLFSTWDRIEENTCSRVYAETIESLFPGDDEMHFRLPWSMSDDGAIRKLMADGGFGSVTIERRRVPVEPFNPRDIATGQVRGTPRGLLLEKRGMTMDAAIDRVAVALEKVRGNAYGQALLVQARA